MNINFVSANCLEFQRREGRQEKNPSTLILQEPGRGGKREVQGFFNLEVSLNCFHFGFAGVLAFINPQVTAVWGTATACASRCCWGGGGTNPCKLLPCFPFLSPSLEVLYEIRVTL